MKYVLKISEYEGVNNCECKQAIDDNGKIKLLHNEVSFNFKKICGKLSVTDGWHIGTESFGFSKAEGDNCENCIEHYHPGLLEQLKALVAV